VIKKQKFNLPDGQGGGDTYHFETSADKVIIDDQPLDDYLEKLSKKPVTVAITIPVTGWVLDNAETSDYKYYFEVEVANLKTADIVEIFYSRGSIGAVLEAGICPSDNAPMSGKFRIYAAAVPTEPINATYVVWKG